MVGVDGRPEIILEGSENVEGPWLEYNFLYKPGNVNHSLPFVGTKPVGVGWHCSKMIFSAPYSPRLDWQMFWAAYSSYEKQPWILSFAHRLLIGRPEVLVLLDKHHSPFSQKPPKYIRAALYKYKYSSWSQRLVFITFLSSFKNIYLTLGLSLRGGFVKESENISQRIRKTHPP
jgi:hypothetical protein